MGHKGIDYKGRGGEGEEGDRQQTPKNITQKDYWDEMINWEIF